MNLAYTSPELIQAVDRLCKPRRHTEVQWVFGIQHTLTLPLWEGGPWTDTPREVALGRKRTTINEPSKLHQLETHIASSLGGNSGGATLANERLVFNAAILEVWQVMTSTLRQWRRADLNYPTVTPNAEQFEAALREYLRVALYIGMHEDVFAMRAATINSWCRQIYTTLDPPREAVLPNTACPECGETDYWKDGALYPHPLVFRYRLGTRHVVDAATGHCRACGTDWTARALAWDLEEAAEGHHLTQRVEDSVQGTFVLE